MAGSASIPFELFKARILERAQGTKIISDNLSMTQSVPNAKTVHLPRYPEVDMELRTASHSEIPPTIPNPDFVELVMKKYALNIPVDKQDVAMTTGDYANATINAIGKAVGRREDFVRIDAMNTAAGVTTINDGGTNLTKAKIQEALRILTNNNASDGMLVLLIGASQQDSLLDDTILSSQDYRTDRPQQDGKFRAKVLDFNILTMGNRVATSGENLGLPKTGDIRTCFAWHVESLWVGYNMRPTIIMDKKGVGVDHIAQMNVGAEVAEPLGVVKIECDETA